MPQILPEHINKAIDNVNILTFEAKETLLSDLYEKQPNLVESILVMNQFGSSYEEVDKLLHLLLVIFLAVQETKLTIPFISENELEKGFKRLSGHINFTEGLSQQQIEQTIEMYRDNHKEKYLFAYVMVMLQESGLLSRKNKNLKGIVLSTLAVVTCIANNL